MYCPPKEIPCCVPVWVCVGVTECVNLCSCGALNPCNHGYQVVHPPMGAHLMTMKKEEESVEGREEEEEGGKGGGGGVFVPSLLPKCYKAFSCQALCNLVTCFVFEYL